MKYGIKTYSQVPNPDGVPDAWIAMSVKYQNDDIKTEQQLITDNFTIQTEIVHNNYISDHQAEYDTWCEIHCKDDLIQSIRDRIDVYTDELIDIGFEYSNVQFKMDVEHQMTYKDVYDFRQYVTFPYTIKGVGENYLTIDNEQDYTTFILYGFQWLTEVITTGWSLKTAVETMTYQQLLAWVDPRI